MSKVIDLQSRREQAETGRESLPKSYLSPEASDFGGRMARIRLSLDKINGLMKVLNETRERAEREELKQRDPRD